MVWNSSEQRGSDNNRIKKKPSITIILPHSSVNGVTKTGLIESRALDANVISLVKERSEYPTLSENVTIKYVSNSEIIGRLMYPHYTDSLDIKHTDLIVAHSNPASVIAHRLYKKKHLPYIAYIHNADQQSIHGTLPKFEKKEIKKALEDAATVLVNSKITAVEIESRYGIKDVTILYPGCIPSKSINQEKNDFYLVVHMVSLSIYFKILYNLLKRNKDINVVIAGGKKYSWQAVYVAFKLKFGHRVKFVFDPSEQTVSDLYMRSKMVLHTAEETFGMSPLEAAGFGTPSVVVKGSGVLEVLEDNKEILSFDGNNIEELDNIIRDYSHDSKKGINLGQRAWQKAQKYGWDFHVQSLQQKINEIIAHR